MSRDGKGDSYGRPQSRLGGYAPIIVDRSSLAGPSTASFATTRERTYKPGADEVWSRCTNCNVIAKPTTVNPLTLLCIHPKACAKRAAEPAMLP